MQSLPILKPADRLGPHEVFEEIGRGSSATVYRAKRIGAEPDGQVALKVRMRGDEELDRRFLREFESLRSISIPGVVRVHGAGQTERYLWYAMDLVQGVDIRTHIHAAGDYGDRCRAAARVGPRLFDTLAAIHRHGLIHRDLKPTNVLVDANEGVHVLDFGIVRWWAQEGTLTLKGNVVGTLPFMAPEQVAGLPLTFHADIFSAGLLLYEGIAGRRPRASGPREWIHLQCLERPAPLCTLSPLIPRTFSTLVEDMLDIDPLRRPEAHQIGAALRDFARGRLASDWPDPPRIVGRTAMVDQLVAALDGRGSRVRALVGPTGSGRHRVAEQVRRNAVLRGFRCIAGRAEEHKVGGAIHRLLMEALDIPPDDRWRRHVGGSDPRSLLEMWPDLPLWSPNDQGERQATRREVAEAAAEALLRVADERGLLIVLEDFDQLDAFTERTVVRLSELLGPTALILLIVDDRWANERCRRTLKLLKEQAYLDATSLVDLPGSEADEIVRALQPEGQGSGSDRSAQRAVEEGWQQLSHIRNEHFPSIVLPVLPLAVAHDPVPRAVVEALGAEPHALVGSGLLREHPPGFYAIEGHRLRKAVLARLEQRQDAEDRLADAMERHGSGPERWAGVARHRLHGKNPQRARIATIHAAIHAQRTGQLNEARNWLLILDELPVTDPVQESTLAFDLIYCQAYTAIHTERSRIREDLVTAALAAAINEEQHGRASLLQAELHARKGNLRSALAQCLNRAAWLERTHASLATQALRQAAALRVALGQPPEALALLDRAEAMRGGRKRDAMQVQLDSTRAQAVFENGDTNHSAGICMEALSVARRLGTDRDEAQLLQQLGLVMFMLGERVQAEGATWKAHRVFTETGDRSRVTETKLLLARLSLGKGDIGGAQLLASEALSVAESLRAHRLVHAALGLSLELATTSLDAERAQQIMERQQALGGSHPSWAASAVRWWRTQGEWSRALRVADAESREGYDGARTAIEAARTYLEVGAVDDLRRELDLAVGVCRVRGFRELLTLAHLVLGGSTDPAESGWASAVQKALSSRWVELSLAALEMDGRRQARLGNPRRARERFLTLQQRAIDLHQVSYQRCAETWLAKVETTGD